MLPDFQTTSPWLNGLMFAGAAVAVWLAGSRLAEYADVIAGRTGLSKALLGLLLLGVATSLPEIVTTTTGAALGTPLVAGNLFGGVALQIAILVMADIVAVRGALTYFAPPAEHRRPGCGTGTRPVNG